MKKIILQGDIKLEVCEAPKGVKEIFAGEEYTLAVGEQTGHSHIVRVKDKPLGVKVFKNAEGQLFVHLEGIGTLTHEGTGTEHGTHKLAPEWYRVGGGQSSVIGEKEYDYFNLESRRVID